MSLATRCNACATVFRVVQDQLRVSDGWVRCGRCNAVFNATDDLFELDERPEDGTGGGTDTETSEPASGNLARQVLDELAAHRIALQSQAPQATPAAWARPQAPRPAEHLQDEFSPPAWPEPVPPATQADHAADLSLDQPQELPAWHDDALDDGHDDDWNNPVNLSAADPDAIAELQPPAAPPAPAGTAIGLATTPGAVQPLALLDDGQPAAIIAWHTREPAVADAPPLFADGPPVPDGMGAQLPDAALPVPSFVQRADRAAFWQTPRLRRSMAGATGVLGLVLLLQIAHAGRDLLAAHVPPLQPALRALCGLTGCTLAPLRRIEQLSVDSAGLSLVDGVPIYRLQLLLHNRADTAVQAPALELTLNDAQGRLLARRVLQGADLGLTSSQLDAGQALPLQVLLSTAEFRVAGYNVELFYP